MTKHNILYLSLLASLLTACSSVDSVKVFDQQQAAILLQQQHQLHPTQQMVKLNLPHKEAWKKIDLSYGTVGSPVMLIHVQGTANNWTQSIRTKISGYRHDPNINANVFIQHLYTQAKTDCPNTDIKILSTQTHFTLYQLTLSGCKQEKNQIQIGKAFNGSDAVYVVYYTAIQNEVGAAEVQQNKAVITAAQLVRR